MKRRSVLNALALSALSLLPLLSHADALSDIQKRGVVRIAVPGDYPPFGVTQADGTLAGYDIDAARLIAQKLGVKAELVPVPVASRVPFLTTGKVDLVVDILGATSERRKVIDFSGTYAPYWNSVWAPQRVAVGKVEELSGKTVGAARGTIEDIELTKLVDTRGIKDVTIKRFEDNNTMISAYVSGQVNILATGNAVIATISEKLPSKSLELKFPIRKSACKVGINKNEPALLAKVNEAIEQSFADGSLAKVSERWLKARLPSQAELDAGVIEP